MEALINLAMVSLAVAIILVAAFGKGGAFDLGIWR